MKTTCSPEPHVLDLSATGLMARRGRPPALPLYKEESAVHHPGGCRPSPFDTLTPAQQERVLGMAKALEQAQRNPEGAKRWFKFYIAYLECVAPGVFQLETGRLVTLLAQHHEGLTRLQLLQTFYERYEQASETRRESLRLSLEKVIQRARSVFAPSDLTVVYNKADKRYVLCVQEEKDSLTPQTNVSYIDNSLDKLDCF